MIRRRALDIVLALLPCVTMGQNVYNNASLIYIGPSSVLYAKDTIINQGTIINNGDIQVGGSWINLSQYEPGAGQITFNSDLPQIINHNDQSFRKLTIAGGGEKIFLADITIEEELDLSAGTLQSGNDAAIYFSPGAVIVGGSDESHVNGPVYHLGTGSKLFPVGNGTVYLPLELLDIQGSSPEVGIRAMELDNTMTLSKNPTLDAVSANRYWEIDLVSGSLENSRVVLPVKEETIANDIDRIVVAQSPALSAPFETLGRSDFQGTAFDGQVTSEKSVTQPYLAIGAALTDMSIVVYNAVSPNGDGLNEFLIIGNIENYPGNKFTLFNRWGDKVFEIENYDNQERVFRGRANIGGDGALVNGTYYYVIETGPNGPKVNGFIAVRN